MSSILDLEDIRALRISIAILQLATNSAPIVTSILPIDSAAQKITRAVYQHGCSNNSQTPD